MFAAFEAQYDIFYCFNTLLGIINNMFDRMLRFQNPPVFERDYDERDQKPANNRTKSDNLSEIKK